jgi:hypothetical protein
MKSGVAERRTPLTQRRDAGPTIRGEEMPRRAKPDPVADALKAIAAIPEDEYDRFVSEFVAIAEDANHPLTELMGRLQFRLNASDKTFLGKRRLWRRQGEGKLLHVFAEGYDSAKKAERKPDSAKAEEIKKLRDDGLSWKKIDKSLGFARGGAQNLLKRAEKAMKQTYPW